MKKLIVILLTVCMLLGCTGAQAALYDTVQEYSMYNSRNRCFGTESVAYVYSTECTKTAISDWYYNYCRDSGNYWNILIYSDQQNGETVYGIVNCGDAIYVNAWVYTAAAGQNQFIMFDPTYADTTYIANQNRRSLAKAKRNQILYVLNTSTGRFHLPDCTLLNSQLPENTWYYTGTYDELVYDAYSPCTRCIVW